MKSRSAVPPHLLFITALLALCMNLISCGRDGDSNDLFSNVADLFSSDIGPEAMSKALNAAGFHDTSGTDVALNSEILKLYQKNENRPLWLSGKAISDRANAAIEAIGELYRDGLRPENYAYAQLNAAQNTLPANEDSLIAFDIMLSRSVVRAAMDLTFGVLNAKEVDQEWHTDNDTLFAVTDLIAAGKDKKDLFSSFRPQDPRYSMMMDALKKWETLRSDSDHIRLKTLIGSGDRSVALDIIKREIAVEGEDPDIVKNYQYLNHLSLTGRIDEALVQVLERSPDAYIEQLKINMERMRWLPNKKEEHYVWVSIPQAEVDYYKDGNNLFHDRAIVGSRSNRTPSILKPMQNIVICPPWGLPHSIVAKDYGGRIPAKYEVFKGGKRVPNSMVNASNYKQFNVRQPPGPSAALGYVKFNLPNKWDIYLHDTPNRNLFGNKMRYLSHGCIRVKDPRVLASIILEDKGIGVDSINNIIKKNKTTFINTKKIPVYISYTTVNADSAMQNLIYLSDPYKKDSVLNSKLLSSNK